MSSNAKNFGRKHVDRPESKSYSDPEMEKYIDKDKVKAFAKKSAEAYKKKQVKEEKERKFGKDVGAEAKNLVDMTKGKKSYNSKNLARASNGEVIGDREDRPVRKEETIPMPTEYGGPYSVRNIYKDK